jgi:MFS family permease
MRLTDWAQKIDLGREIQEVYVHSLLFKLAKKLIAIFIPLYLLELGYAPTGVILFFLAYYMTYIFLSFPNAKIASRIGYKHSSLLASPIILGFYILLRNMQVSTPELLFVGVVGGVGSNLYWTGMNPEVATSSHSEDREKETGYFFSMPALASIFSPLAGGLILAVFNFQVLLLFTVLLVALSFTPFLFSREHSKGMELDIRSFLEDADFIDFATFTFKGVNSIGKKVVWPLYLALVIESSLSIGGAGSILAIGSAVTSIFIGRIADNDNRGKIITIGTLLAGASYVLMSQVTTPLAAFAISGLNGLSYTAASIPIYSKAMDHSEREDVIEYFAFREISLATGRITTLLLIVFFLTSFETSKALTASFLFIAASVLITGQLGKRMEN